MPTLETDLLECGHPESPHAECTTGFGRDSSGNRFCYDCCHAQDRAAIRTGEPLFAYLTKDTDGAWIISNWPGRPLMRVIDHWALNNRWVRNGGVADDLYHIQAVDADGRQWYGRGMGEGDVLPAPSREGLTSRVRVARGTMV